MTRKELRVAGTTICLAAVIYLVAHHVLVLLVGWPRLYRLLGETAYNALIPGGGLALVGPLTVSMLVSLCSLAALEHALARLGRSAAQDRRRSLTLRGAAFVILCGLVHYALFMSSFSADVYADLVGHATEYAPQFSESAFDEIEAGLSDEEVVRLLGRPLNVMTYTASGLTAWHYTSESGPGLWKQRIVDFDSSSMRVLRARRQLGD